ncbi:MAG: hypothetical protein V4690_01585 [Patescibacteria group bacterium]
MTPEMRKKLFMTAREMLVAREYRKGFLTEESAGVVVTSFKEGMLGQITGVAFSAEVESDKGRGTVTYLVNPKEIGNMDDAQWISLQDYIRESQRMASVN